MLPLDTALLVTSIIVAWSTRTAAPISPGLLTCAHWLIAARIIPMPRTATDQALAHVVAGFVLLLGSLGLSVWWTRRRARSPSS